jgi:hypothetical protein
MDTLIVVGLIFFILLGYFAQIQEKNELKNKKEEYKFSEKKDEEASPLSNASRIKIGDYEPTINTDLYYNKVGDYATSENRGIAAELKVRKELEIIKFPQYHNFTFKLEAKIFKIDHLLITPSGCFIIETKRWRGSIEILDDSSTVQLKTKRYGKKEYTNPIIALNEVKESLSKLTGIDINNLKLVLIFIDSTSLNAESNYAKLFTNTGIMMNYLSKVSKPQKLDKNNIDNIIKKLNIIYEPISREEYYRIKHN